MSRFVVKVNCRACGPIQLSPDEVVVEMGTQTGGLADYVRFVCCDCSTRNRLAVSAQNAGRLVFDAGCVVVVPRDPITMAEVRRFRRDLRRASADVVFGELSC